MTLGFSAVSRAWVMQVADRLLSQQKGAGYEPWDPLANKSVLLIANNAIASFTFAGLAYIGETRTDQWLVETILGEKIRRQDGFFPTHFGGQSRPIHFGPALQTVMAAIERDFVAQPASRRAQGLQVAVTAFNYRVRRNTRRPPLPSMMRMIHTGEPGTELRCGRLSHHWYRHPGDIRFTSIGAGCGPETARIKEALSGVIDEDTMEDILATAIRAAASRHPDTIGRDLMSIAINRKHQARVRFMRDPAVPSPKEAYTPWIVANRVVQPPQVLEGGGGRQGLRIGSVDVGFDQVPELPNTGRWSSTGQRPKPLR